MELYSVEVVQCLLQVEDKGALLGILLVLLLSIVRCNVVGTGGGLGYNV